MDASHFSVHMLRCPFGIRELRFTSVERSPASSVLPPDPHYAHVTGTGDDNEGLLRSYAVAGTRGIQQLVATTRGAQAVSDTTSTSAEATNGGRKNGASSASAAALHADVFSIHDKGRLMMWDSDTGRLVSSHAFHPTFTVHQCAAAGSCIYTTLEGSPDTTGAEEETCVYAWDRTTLQPVTVLRGHEGRLTALAVAPPSASAATGDQSVVLATASLDGTLRLWRHRSGRSPGGASGEGPVQVLAVLPTTELGFLNGLSFLSADVLVAACSKCALAFLRIPASTPAFGETLKWQLVRSPVDPDGSTTALHVCPFSPFDTRRTTNTGAAAAALALQPSLPVSDARRRKNIVTGSTSGYTQEWSIEITDGADYSAATQKEIAAPTSPLVIAAAGVVVRGRWHHKAHAATVGCIVTDEDVAVTTSIFDGARLYHRRAGATCVITTASMVPVLVPQVKQLVWGSVDGTLSVASYALFAAGTEKQLQLLWTARPHNAAVRGVCLSLTAGLQWRALCVGAADGSVSVWCPASAVAGPMASGKSAAAVFGQVLDMHVSDLASPCVTVVGLRREGRGYVLAVAEMDAASGATKANSTLPLPAQTAGAADAVTCARLCGGAETSHYICLVVGTRGGQLLCSTKDAKQGVWRPLQPCAWTTAVGGGQRATITAVSPLLTVPSHGTLMAVVSYGTVSASLTMQRVLISILHTHAEKGSLVVDKMSRWEGFVDVSVPTRSGVFTGLPSDSGDPIFSVEWLMPPSPPAGGASSTGAGRRKSDAAAATAAVPGVVVRDSHGMLVRCKSAADDGSEPAGKPKSKHPWATPELLLQPSTLTDRSSAAITATLDGHRVAVLVSDGASSDIVSLNLLTNRKRVLLKVSDRHDDVSSIMCDVGNSAVRLAAVRVGGGAARLCDVSLYDDKGQEQYRVTRSGAIVSCASADPSALKKQVSLAPSLNTALSQVSSARSPSPSPSTVCTLLAASADDRVIFVGYNDGLFQMVDTAGMFVFQRMWIADETGTARAIRDVNYGRGVVLVRLANDCVRTIVMPARSILDQPMATK